MGSLGQETYTDDIQPVLADWLNNRTIGQAISDYPLILANRAMKSLWMAREWQRLMKETALTITSGVASLPAKFGREVAIGSSLADSGQIDWKFCKDSQVGRGYKITSTFDKATGHTMSMTFFTPYDTGSTIYLRYIEYLDNFTGTGTEYSFFPANLIILAAQKINTAEQAKIQENQLITQRYEDELLRYCNSVQNNNAGFDAGILPDRYGNEVSIQNYKIDGSIDKGYFDSRYPNSRRP